MTALNIAIPVYEYGGVGHELLQWSFKIMSEQTFDDFSVVISDNSQDDKVKNVCKDWSQFLDIEYYYNDNRGAAINSNNAILKCRAPLIKFLCADDYLYDENSLQYVMDGFEDPQVNWLFTEYVHTTDRVNYYRHYIPSINPNLVFINSLGTPSALAMRNPRLLPAIDLFDANLSYSYDCEFYYRMYRLFGPPKIVNQIAMVNYVWNGSVTSTVDQNLINKENQYILHKYGVIK